MAKKAPILAKDYNPVGARLQRISVPPLLSSVEPTPSESGAETDSVPIENPTLPVTTPAQTVAPAEKESMAYELRCRCTKTERKKWHDFAYKITGEPNRFSHLFRALLLLLEHGDTEFEKLKPILHGLKPPAKNDSLAVTLYEQKLAEVIWEALRRAGRLEAQRL